MKIALITLGCPKNVVDSEYLQGSLAGPQAEFVTQVEAAEVIIINTCGFIQSAKEESIDTILEAARLKETGHCRQLLVVGCLVNRYADELAIYLPEVDGFYSSRDLPRMISKIGEKLGVPCHQLPVRKILTPPHFAYLKIAEGCNNRCSYCAIPLIRGPQQSRRDVEIITEAHELVANGARELILIAQDITNYGADLSQPKTLPKLIREIIAIDQLKWLRLMYAHPAHVTDELIELIGNESKICKYLDLPIQHISDKLLKRMGRNVDRRQIEAVIEKLRKVPEIALRTSVILGFPGETDADFNELVDFISTVKFERLGAFNYSAEEGTAAYNFENQVAPATRNERFEVIMDIQAEISLNRNLALVGSKLEVLVDEFEDSLGQFAARTQWDAPEVDNLIWLTTNDVSIGEYREIIVNQAFEFDLIGSVQ